jgi:hypothetical protein
VSKYFYGGVVMYSIDQLASMSVVLLQEIYKLYQEQDLSYDLLLEHSEIKLNFLKKYFNKFKNNSLASEIQDLFTIYDHILIKKQLT